MNEPVLVTAPVPDGNRRLKILIGIAVALALLMFVGPRVLDGGGDGGSDDVDSLQAPIVPTSTTAAPTAGPADVEAVDLPLSDKDPFAPLVAPRAPAAAAPVTKADRTTKRIRLADVYADAAGRSTAKVKLDGKDVVVKENQQFAGTYRVLSLDLAAKCGNFLYGDQPFSLCAGEETSF